MDISPLEVRKAAEDRPRSRVTVAVGVCDLPLLGLLLVGAGTTGVSCSFKVAVVTENP
jgi:hypothetical protein